MDTEDRLVGFGSAPQLLEGSPTLSNGVHIGRRFAFSDVVARSEVAGKLPICTRICLGRNAGTLGVETETGVLERSPFIAGLGAFSSFVGCRDRNTICVPSVLGKPNDELFVRQRRISLRGITAVAAHLSHSESHRCGGDRECDVEREG